MELTLEELEALEPGSYTLLDLRSEQETAYGTIPGSVPANAAALPEGLPAEPGRIVLFCTRGKLSLETAERLRDEGFDACSLKGGYLAWLMRQMQRQEAEELQRYTKFPFSVEYLVMDPGYSPENRRVIEENARKLNIPIHIFESNIFDYVYNVDRSPCYLCARMRRGHLYDYARRLGCNKIALGHHYDDVIETILMGMLYGAQVQTMMPKLHSTNFPGMELIRPLYLIREDDIKAWRDANELHFIQCACHFTDTCTTCSNQETRSKRQEIKDLIRTLKQRNPDVEAHIFRSVENVNLDTVIGWKTGGKKYSFLDRYDEEA